MDKYRSTIYQDKLYQDTNENILSKSFPKGLRDRKSCNVINVIVYKKKKDHTLNVYKHFTLNNLH